MIDGKKRKNYYVNDSVGLACGFFLAAVHNGDGSRHIAPYYVSATRDGYQGSPDVAMTPGGDYIVAWGDDQDENGVTQVRAEGYYSSGDLWLDEFTVNSVATGNQFSPAIAIGKPSMLFLPYASKDIPFLN